MYGLFVQIAILVAMTHGLRALGHVAGPRRCGLILGLPSATALMLLYCGHEYGVGEAMAAAESSLLGLVAAAALPLAYGWTIRVAPRPLLAPASAIAAYVAIAAAVRVLPGGGAAARVELALAGVLVACSLARRVRIAGGEPSPSAGPWLRHLALGTMVPAILIVTVRTVRALGGASWAGLFTTFPAMSLAVLVATHLEAGPVAACRMARAMPPGNLITLMFLAAFRFAGHRFGLAWGTACGYALALATLLALEGLVPGMAGAESSTPRSDSRSAGASKTPPQPPRLDSFALPQPINRRRRRFERRFAPRVEMIPEGCGVYSILTG
jgi:hypothetical protein